MKPATTYEDVCDYIAWNYYGVCGQEIPPEPSSKVRMVGLLFPRPDDTFAQAEVVPHLDYFHYRSGKHIDFFCAGYDGYTGRGEGEGYRKVNRELVLKWGFSEQVFVQFVEEVQSQSSWKYNGDPCLILTNAHYDPVRGRVFLDLKHSKVQCKLRQMKDIGAIASVTSLFEDIIKYAESADAEDPTSGFSDAQGTKHAVSALYRFILSLLPKDLGKEVERAKHFAVIDG